MRVTGGPSGLAGGVGFILLNLCHLKSLMCGRDQVSGHWAPVTEDTRGWFTAHLGGRSMAPSAWVQRPRRWGGDEPGVWASLAGRGRGGPWVYWG